MPPPLKMQIFKVVLAISSVQLAVARDLGEKSFIDYVDTLDQLDTDLWMRDNRGLLKGSDGPYDPEDPTDPPDDPKDDPRDDPSDGPSDTTVKGPFDPDPSDGPGTTLPPVKLPDPIEIAEDLKAVNGPTKFVRLEYNAMSFKALNENKEVQAQLQQTTKDTMISANPQVALFYSLFVNFHPSGGRRLTSSGRRLTDSAGVIIETAMVQKNLTGTNVSAADLETFSSSFTADIGGALTTNIQQSVDVSTLLKDGHAKLDHPVAVLFVAEVGSNTASAIEVHHPPTPTSTVTEAPVTEAPVTEAPVTEAPVTEAPVTEAPVTEAPTTVAPEETTPAPSPTPMVVPTPAPTPATTDVEDDNSALSLRLLWAVGAMMAPYLMI